MGGKQKHAQRTKGNTRPSSSGHSADKLMASGMNVTAGFSGFGAIQLQNEHLGLMKAKAPTAEMDPLIDGDCRMLMKRMTKKDAITRLKALQEFQLFCMQCTDEALLGALPFWPRLFNKLCLDSDRRVREATHTANVQLVKRAKRNLAPHLKSMMGNWLMAQCDPHAPAASAAKLAFQTAFVQGKQLEALVFCKEEILGAIVEHLFHHTPQTLSDPEVTPVEEMEEIYNRVVSSFLKAFALFLDQLSIDEHEKLTEKYKSVVSEAKFWKYAKSKVPQICSSWFSAVAVLCRVIPSTLDSYLSKLCPAVLGRLDETDPLIVSSVWDAALHILVVFEKCWEYVNLQKTVLPKLCYLLRKGCDGNADTICPYMLPLLSKVPLKSIIGAEGFYGEFFASIRHGLSLSKVQQSFSECTALFTAYFECLKWIFTEISCLPESASTPLAEDLILNQLFPVVEACLLESTASLTRDTPLFACLGAFLNYIHHQALLEDDSSTLFQKSEKIFWEKFGIICQAFLSDYKEPKEFSLISLSSMFSVFMNAECLSNPKKKHTGKVRFSDSAECTSGLPFANPLKHSSKVLLHHPFVVDSKDLRVQCAFNLSSIALQGFLSEMSTPFIVFVSEMSKTFASTDFFKALLQPPVLLKCPNLNGSEDLAWIFYEEFILKWLPIGKDSNDSKLISSITALTFAILRCFNGDDKKLAVLNKLCDAGSIYLLEAVLQIVMPFHPQLGYVREWIKGKNFSSRILRCAEFLPNTLEQHRQEKSALHSEEKAVWNMLTICLTSLEDLEPPLTYDCVVKILNVMLQLSILLTDDVCNSCVKIFDPICKLASEFFKNASYCWTFHESDGLLLAFFKLGFGKALRTESLRVSVEKIWTSGVTSLIKTQGGLLIPGKFLHAATCYMHDLVLLGDCTKDHLNAISVTFTKFLGVILSVVPLGPDSLMSDNASPSLLEELLMLILPVEEEWHQMTEKLCENMLFGDALRGKLFLRHLPVLQEMDHYVNCNVSLASSISAVNLLTELCKEWEKADMVFDPRHFLNQLLGILNVWTYCKLAAEHIKDFSEQVDGEDLIHWSLILKDKFHFLLNKVSVNPGLEQHLLSAAFQKAETEIHGSLWAYSLRELLDIFNECDININIMKLITLITYESVLENDVALHALKVLLPLDKQLSFNFLSSALSSKELSLLHDATRSTTSIAIIQVCLENLTCEDAKQLNVIDKLMEVLLRWKESGDVYLFECKIPHEWTPVCRNIEVAKVLSVVTSRFYSSLSSAHWDFILCSLGSWVKSCYESCSDFITPTLEIQVFGSTIFHLTHTVASLLDSSLALSCEQRNIFPPDLFTEWQEFFAVSIFTPMLSLFLGITESYSTRVGQLLTDSYVLENLVNALQWTPVHVIENNNLSPLLVAEWDENDSSTPIKVKTALNRLCPLLVSSVRDIRLGAYAILRNLMLALPKFDEQKSEKAIEATKDISLIPTSLLTVLLQANSIVETLLSDFNLGDACVVQPHTDSYSFTFAYLYTWSLVLQLFSSLSVEMKSRLASYLRDSELVSSLLQNLFRLMPIDASSRDLFMPSVQRHTTSITQRTNLFVGMPLFDPQSCTSSFELQHLACYLYYEALHQIPVLAREWWIGADKRIASLVEKFTAKHVSPLLCCEDISAVQRAEKKFSNMTIRARLTSREVVATYAVDEISFELTVRLAENHPLGAVAIETGRRMGVSNQQWSYWLLQLTTFLMHQNGSILDGLVMWKRNIDKKFEGVEECYVCFYVLHSTTSQLPRLVCRTCKKKFHSSCLYKWFNTSGHSTCPLCRSIF